MNVISKEQNKCICRHVICKSDTTTKEKTTKRVMLKALGSNSWWVGLNLSLRVELWRLEVTCQKTRVGLLKFQFLYICAIILVKIISQKFIPFSIIRITTTRKETKKTIMIVFCWCGTIINTNIIENNILAWDNIIAHMMWLVILELLCQTSLA